MYSRKCVGLRMEPWGTPVRIYKDKQLSDLKNLVMISSMKTHSSFPANIISISAFFLTRKLVAFK